MQSCPGCGIQLPDQASFCAHCGRALTPSHTPPSQDSNVSEPATMQETDEPQQTVQDVPTPSDAPLPNGEAQIVEPSTLATTSSPSLDEASDSQAHAQEVPPATSANDSEAGTLAFPAFEKTLLPETKAEESKLAFPAFEETPIPAGATREHIDASKPAQTLLSQDAALLTEVESPVPQTPFPHEVARPEQEPEPIPQTPLPAELAEAAGDKKSVPQIPFPGEAEEASKQATAEQDEKPVSQIPFPGESESSEQDERSVSQIPFPGESESSKQAPETSSHTPLTAESAEQGQEEKEPVQQIPFPDEPIESEQSVSEPEREFAAQTPLSTQPAEPDKSAEVPTPQMPFPDELVPVAEINNTAVQDQAQAPQLGAEFAVAEKAHSDSEKSAEVVPTSSAAHTEPKEAPELPAQRQESTLIEPAHTEQKASVEPQTYTQSAPSDQAVATEERQTAASQKQSESPSDGKLTPVEQVETIALAPDAKVREPKETAKPQPPSQPSAPGNKSGPPKIEEEKTRAWSAPVSGPSERTKTEAPERKAPSTPPVPAKPAAHQRNELAEQETLVVPAIRKAAQARSAGPQPGLAAQPRTENYAVRDKTNYREDRPAPKAVRTIGGLIWSLISPIFKRAHDPEPERPGVVQPRPSQFGWLPIFALSSAFGLFTVSTAFNAARALSPEAEVYYWLGIGLIYLPIVVRLIMPHASRAERVGLIFIAALCLFLTKVSLSPLFYSGYDEYLHWRSLNDILSTGHLLTKNPLLPVSPFYPGLEIAASAVSRISGMSSIQAGFTVVGTSCVLMVLSLFLLAETLTGSARLASIAAIIFMANPHFLFFDTQFAYESLALPLATVVMLALARYETFNRYRVWIMLVAWTVLLAMDLTHHATNFVFEGLFFLWAIVYLFLRPLPLHKSLVIRTVFVGLALTVTTILIIGNTVIGYFTSFFSDISAEVAKDLGAAGSNSRQLFGGAGTAIPTPLWERLISLGSVGLITLAIPFLLLCFWRRYRNNGLLWVFAIVVTFYPVLQVLRLTTSGAEISDRASSFIFIAISILGAIAIVQFWPVRLLNWRHSAVISATILILFMGGIILGEGIPPAFMPGPYLASADGRSVDPEGIQAALWANTYLGPNKRMYTDRINQLLMSVYGDQYLVTKIGDNIDVTDVIFDTTFTNSDTQLLKEGQVHYLAVDLRLSTQLPQDGFYYEQGEASTGPNGDNVAINKICLTKFDGVPEINRLFDSGNIAVYDTGGLINAPPIP